LIEEDPAVLTAIRGVDRAETGDLPLFPRDIGAQEIYAFDFASTMKKGRRPRHIHAEASQG